MGQVKIKNMVNALFNNKIRVMGHFDLGTREPKEYECAAVHLN
jgi:hypothetical protein